LKKIAIVMFLLKMRSTLLLLLVFIFVLPDCTDLYRRLAIMTDKSNWLFEGWACAPDATQIKNSINPVHFCDKGEKKEYLYMKFTAAPSKKALESDRIGQIRTSCREAASRQIQGEGLDKIIGSYLVTATGDEINQASGSALVKRYEGRIKGTGIYQCCALGENSESCRKNDEKEDRSRCLCIGYLRFPGGREAFDTIIQEIKSE